MQWRDPEPWEVRRSGHALFTIGGYVVPVESCRVCAMTLGLGWLPAFFEGTCQGCEVRLSGFPV